jgi:glutamate-ammonia-ligase adenylyltransferase
VESFERYQQRDAWVWEHQALLRSRALAGAPAVRARFERIRRETLTRNVARDKLKPEIEKMRTHMRTELSLGKGRGFDLKQDPGGLADIEFLVDYWVLANSDRHPELVEFPDNIRQLEALERTGLVPAVTCRRLAAAYLALRQRVHELALDEAGRVVPDTELAQERAFVVAAWKGAFGG